MSQRKRANQRKMKVGVMKNEMILGETINGAVVGMINAMTAEMTGETTEGMTDGMIGGMTDGVNVITDVMTDVMIGDGTIAAETIRRITIV